MAATNLTNGAGHPAGTTQATASITPAANALIFAWVSQHSIGSTPGVPTCAGNGLTWVQVATVIFSPATTGVSRITLFRAMGASPTTGAVTFTWAGAPAEGACWSVDQHTSTDTSGTNGSGAIAQAAVTNTGTTSAESAGFGAITAGNTVTGGFAHDAADGSLADTVGAGFTPLANVGFTLSSDNDGHLLTEVKAAQTGVTATAASFFQGWGGISVEIKAAAAGNLPDDDSFIPARAVREDSVVVMVG